jgi:hypothetical protein
MLFDQLTSCQNPFNNLQHKIKLVLQNFYKILYDLIWEPKRLISIYFFLIIYANNFTKELIELGEGNNVKGIKRKKRRIMMSKIILNEFTNTG